MRYLVIVLLVCGGILNLNAAPQLAEARNEEECRPVNLTDAQALLQRAVEALGMGEKVLHIQAMEDVLQNFQSERTYPPFFSAMRSVESWYDPGNRVERAEVEMVYPGMWMQAFPARLQSEQGSYMVRDTLRRPVSGGASKMNAWAVVQTWEKASDVRVAEQCKYRDYWRVVLTKPGEVGEERLYLDQKTGLPTKVDLWEKHYLWGQVRVEYLYSLWEKVEGAYVPQASFRVVDGLAETKRTVGHIELLASGDAPFMVLPEDPQRTPAQVPRFLRPTPVDTVRLGDNTFMLANPGYNEVVALIDGTIYVFDATQGEERARQDASWISNLFPGEYPIVVVVTDLAWPHIAGVRYWVAQGASIISHRASESFLRRVVERKWTMNPDLLEERRESMAFSFTGIDEIHTLAGGKLQLIPIDGLGSEGAIMAYLPEDYFLWAGDFVQRVDAPSSYTSEVWQAAQRAKVQPRHTAAQHLPLTPWETIEGLQGE